MARRRKTNAKGGSDPKPQAGSEAPEARKPADTPPAGDDAASRPDQEAAARPGGAVSGGGTAGGAGGTEPVPTRSTISGGEGNGEGAETPDAGEPTDDAATGETPDDAVDLDVIVDVTAMDDPSITAFIAASSAYGRCFQPCAEGMDYHWTCCDPDTIDVAIDRAAAFIRAHPQAPIEAVHIDLKMRGRLTVDSAWADLPEDYRQAWSIFRLVLLAIDGAGLKIREAHAMALLPEQYRPQPMPRDQLAGLPADTSPLTDTARRTSAR